MDIDAADIEGSLYHHTQEIFFVLLGDGHNGFMLVDEPVITSEYFQLCECWAHKDFPVIVRHWW